MNLERLKSAQSQSDSLFMRFTNSERSFFAKRLAFLLRAGVPLSDALSLVREQTRSRRKALVMGRIYEDVSAGRTLSESIKRHAPSMGQFAIHIILIGERAGVLSENLGYLADELSKRHALTRKVRGALVYPVIVTLATIAVTAMLTLFVFPRVMPVFMSLGVELPFTTRALLAVSSFLSHWGLHVIAGSVAVLCGIIFLRRYSESFGYAFDKLVLIMPIVGPIARAYNSANLCRTLALLLRSGITVNESLTVVAETTQNRAFGRALMRASEDIVRGGSIARSLSRERGLMDDVLPHLVMVGETAGSLTDTLQYLARFFEEEVDERTKNLSNAIEPILLLAMGAIVGFVAISIITPIYDITKNLHQR